MDKKNEKINNLQAEFNKIQEENKDLDVNMYLAKMDDLPELGEIQIYDYESDVEEARNRAGNVLDSLVDLYLGDAPNVVSHSYIKNKVEEDSLVYAETLFLTKMARKTFIMQLRQIDNGTNGPRDFEVINQTMGQVRDNIKFANTQKSEIEKSYLNLRKDLGLNEIETKETDIIQEDGTVKEENIVVDSRRMNDIIAKLRK